VEAILTEAMFTIPSNKKIKKLKVDEKYAKTQLESTNLAKLRS
jgi:ATP-dependent protease Clp ATPase subunit